MALNSPPWAWPGLGSKVSIWLGPPVIQSRMHDLPRLGCLAASAARASIQPEVEKLTTPAAASRSIWRRDRSGTEWLERFMICPSRRGAGSRV